jgi:hypothetical protein
VLVEERGLGVANVQEAGRFWWETRANLALDGVLQGRILAGALVVLLVRLLGRDLVLVGGKLGRGLQHVKPLLESVADGGRGTLHCSEIRGTLEWYEVAPHTADGCPHSNVSQSNARADEMSR